MLNWELLDLLKARIVNCNSKVTEYPWGSIRSVLIKILMITGKVLHTNCLYNVVNLASTKVDKTCQLQEVSGNWRELVTAFSIALIEPDVVTTRKEAPQDRGEIYAVIHHSTTNFSSFRLSTVRGSLHLHGKWNAILFNYVVDPPT